MMRYSGSTIQRPPPTAPSATVYDADSAVIYAQPVRDVENSRPAPPTVNLVGPNQSALIYISDNPVNSSILEMQQARRALPVPAAELSPRADESTAGRISARQLKLISGFLGGCFIIGAGAAAYKKMQS